MNHDAATFENEKHKFHLNTVKTVIVGIDLSHESKGLVKEGLQLAKLWDAKLVLAHVIPLDPYCGT